MERTNRPLAVGRRRLHSRATFLFDAADRQTGVVNGASKALTYTLDPNANRVVLLDCDGGLTSYSWDAANRLVGILNPFNEQTTLQYDALDRESLKTLANGMQVSHLFDNAGREVLLANLGPSGAALSMYTASYDPVGNRIGVVELDGTVLTFLYDASYQLVNEQRSAGMEGVLAYDSANAYDSPISYDGATSVAAYNTSYLYDGAGNRTVKNDSGALTSYLYNQANELTLTTPPTGQPTTSSYDGNGNLTVENAGGQLTSYSWDPENRLVGVAYPSGAPDTFLYSADNLRQRKITAAGTVQFVWDEQNVLLETDQSGLSQAHYTDFPGYWGGLTSQRRSGVSSFYGADQQLNVRLLVNALGVVSDSYGYKAFGEESSASGTTVNPYRFGGPAGYYRDLVARLYVSNRHYEPALGRWISPDPLFDWDEQGSRYLYVANSPLTAVDPSGLSGSHPSGPYHPPPGVATKCRPGDGCPRLKAKLWLLARMITSHVVWDQVMPSPRGAARHSTEIPALWIQYGECVSLYIAAGCGPPPPKPRTARQKVPSRVKPRVTVRALCPVPGIRPGAVRQPLPAFPDVYMPVPGLGGYEPIPNRPAAPVLPGDPWERAGAVPPAGRTAHDVTVVVGGSATAGVIIYWVISEASRFFPPRNLVPVP